MTKKLKYGLIGCGGCGEFKHLASYKKYPEEAFKMMQIIDAIYASSESGSEVVIGKQRRTHGK